MTGRKTSGIVCGLFFYFSVLCTDHPSAVFPRQLDDGVNDYNKDEERFIVSSNSERLYWSRFEGGRR